MDHDSDIDYLQRLVVQTRHGLKICNRVAQQLRTAVGDVHNTVDGIDRVVGRLAQALPADRPPDGVDQYAKFKDASMTPMVDLLSQPPDTNTEPRAKPQNTAPDDNVMSELDELIARVDYMHAEMCAMQQAARARAAKDAKQLPRAKLGPRTRTLSGDEVARILQNEDAAQSAQLVQPQD